MLSGIRYLVISIAAILVSMSTAFGAEGEYVFVLKGRGNIFWKTVYDGISETAKEKGITAVLYSTDNDQSPEAQLNICLTALARKPKVMVVGAATKSVGIECYRKALAAGILVADIDGNVTVEDAKAAGIELAFTVASDNTLIGHNAAQYVATIAPRTSKILLIRGLPGSIVSEKRARGFLDGLKEALPGATIVASPAADWDRMKAMNITLDTLQREPDLDLIFSVSDVMTMGVVEALRVTGKERQIRVVSVDGIKDARDAILQGRMSGNVAQLPYLMGKRAVELAIEAANTPLRERTEYTPTPTLTKEVLEKMEDPNLAYLR